MLPPQRSILFRFWNGACRVGLGAMLLWVGLETLAGPSCLAQDAAPRPEADVVPSEPPATPLEGVPWEESLATSDLAIPAAVPSAAPALPPGPPPDPLRWESGSLRLKFSLDGVFQQSGVTGSWWNLSEEFAPDQLYQNDRAWAETWIKPGLRVETQANDWLNLYGGVAYVGSGNIGKDVFEQGNRGQWSTEEAYLGTRFDLPDESSSLDLSYGQQPYKIGSGMLISVGAMNGFERGATTTFARRAWEQAGLVRWTSGTLSLDGFYLDPNELPSADSFTRLAGTRLEWNPDPNQSVGVAYLNVFDSMYPYVAAPLRLIPDGRRGLNTIHFYERSTPLAESLPGWTIATDYAYQWNDRIDMSAYAYSLETGYSFGKLPLTPRLVYCFRYFSGDDPGTAAYEKFDPLYYEGAPSLWATGSNGSFSFLNSNVFAHRVSLNLTIDPRNFVNVYYWHIRAAQVDSPVQFGQAGRFAPAGGEPWLVSGVPTAHLSDDFYTEYTRVLTQNIFLTTGVAVSVPGRGLRSLVKNPETWVGGLVNVTMKY